MLLPTRISLKYCFATNPSNQLRVSIVLFHRLFPHIPSGFSKLQINDSEFPHHLPEKSWCETSLPKKGEVSKQHDLVWKYLYFRKWISICNIHQNKFLRFNMLGTNQNLETYFVILLSLDKKRLPKSGFWCFNIQHPSFCSMHPSITIKRSLFFTDSPAPLAKKDTRIDTSRCLWWYQARCCKGNERAVCTWRTRPMLTYPKVMPHHIETW